MKKIYLVLFLISILLASKAQQSEQYSQFMLNNYGLNPAVAGSSNSPMFMVGNRTQWRGFDAAPVTQFFNVDKSFGKKGYKRFWHGVGVYIEQDKMGVFTSKMAFASYAIHLKVSPTYRFSAGISAGIRSTALSNAFFSTNDPAFIHNSNKVITPDIFPGVYLYSKKLSVGISVHNVYKNSLKFGKKQIGDDSSGVSKLRPAAYFDINRKFVSGGYNYIFIPAIQIQSDFIGIPSVNVNFMAYYKKRVGLGVNYRVHDAVSAILQVRIWKNLIVGFAYDYTISRFRVANANSDEVMMGFSPVMNTDELDKKGTNNCPKFEF